MLFLFLRYINVCNDFFGYVEKQLDKKAKVISKIYVTTWKTNNHNTRIS